MVRFNPKARLDRSRVRDVGGSGGGGGGLGGGMGGPGMRIPIPGLGGGGIKGILILIVIVVIAKFLGFDLLGMLTGSGGGYSTARISDAQSTGRYDNCETGEDANESHDCARVAIENSLTDFWEGSGVDGVTAVEGLVTFSGQVNTACGAADSTVGPFYCPGDETIYLDTTFFDQVLEQQLGGPDGGFVEFYVLAHEYGHHISNATGFMSKVRSQSTGPTSPSTRLELQADCFAGLWAQHATETEDAEGQVLLTDLSDEDIKLALEAARAVGDDYIQQRMGGRVDAESWTHGSSDQREHWFRVGFEGGSFDDCDTFSASESEVLGE